MHISLNASHQTTQSIAILLVTQSVLSMYSLPLPLKGFEVGNMTKIYDVKG